MVGLSDTLINRHHSTLHTVFMWKIIIKQPKILLKSIKYIFYKKTYSNWIKALVYGFPSTVTTYFHETTQSITDKSSKGIRTHDPHV